MRRAIGMVVFAFLLGATTGCTNGGDNSTEEPPWGLDALTLPSDQGAIEDVFAAMPDEVAGHARLEGGTSEADYEGDALVVSSPVAKGMGGATVRDYVSTLAKAAAPGEIEAQQLDGALVYLVFNTIGDGRRVYLAAWGNPDATNVFGVKAETPEDRIALVRAFLEAAS